MSKIKELLIQKIKEEVKSQDYKGYVRVSEVSICPVRAYYSYKGLQQEIEDDKVLVLEIGSKLHEFLLQHYLDDILEGKEVEFVRKHKDKLIIGHVDGIANIDGERYILEFKTIADKKYRNGKSTLDYLPSEHHVLQLGIYMLMSGIEKGKLVYLLKSSAEVVEVDVELDDELLAKIKEVMDETIDFIKLVENDTEMEAEAISRIYDEMLSDKATSWKCNYCGFRSHCEKAKSDAVLNQLDYV